MAIVPQARLTFVARQRGPDQTQNMNQLRRFIKTYPVVTSTLVVGLVTLWIWSIGETLAAQTLATIYVGSFVLWTSIGMIRDMVAGNFGLDILAVVAMVSTLTVGEFGAALIIVLMLSGGEALEDFAAGRAKRELTALLEQAPQRAHRFSTASTGGEETIHDIDASDVEVGAELLVRPGELVPVDCVLLSPTGSFDESSITGEAMLQTRVMGEEIASGVLNGSAAVRVRALRTTENSQYQQIIALVQEAEKSKAPVVRLADRFALPFTGLALVIGGAAWAITGDPVRFAEVLVLATPCPLLIAAPVAFLGGLSFSAKNGIVLKGGAALETLARIRSAGFDKTGTITRGHPALSRIEVQPDWGPWELFRLAASTERYSGHVLASSIVRAAVEQGVELAGVTHASEDTGNGVQAEIDGKIVRVGRAKYVGNGSGAVSPLDLTAGESAVYVSVDGVYAGVIVLADDIRPESEAVISYLRSAGVETIMMITGDSQATADAIASQAGISEVLAGVKPGGKVAAVHALGPHPTLMVGDGVNDAPALAAADVGIAMGARGATAAGEAADAVIVQDSLTKVAEAHAIAKHTLRVALTAIWIGIILSVGLMLIATTGAIPAMVGALTQELVDLATILYALRALRTKLPVLKIGLV